MVKTLSLLIIVTILGFFNVYGDITIRQATLDDLNDLCHYIDAEYKKHFRDVFEKISAITSLDQSLDDFMDEKIALQKKNTQEFLTKTINDTTYTILVAFNDKELVGYCRFRKTDDQTVYIYSLSIATNAQRQGIGTRLMSAAINIFDGVTQCRLRAFITNDQAHNFYHKLGFEQVDTSALDPRSGVVIQNKDAIPTHIDYRLVIK